MGYMRHHAIIVTDYDFKPEDIEAAHHKAQSLGMIVTPITKTPMNGYLTFLVCPDGSKEGWAESDEGDARREALLNFLDLYSFQWVEVQYADDAGVTCVTRSHQDY